MTSQVSLYFGYGSNLWLEQMHLRCPNSAYVGVGRLNGFRWIINQRGYANVVQVKDSNSVVYGLIYHVTPEDEARLDINEGVPHAYTKEILTCEFWSSAVDEGHVNETKVDVAQPGRDTSMLVYINRQKTTESLPKDEYVHRMNKGIADAVAMGVPTKYVQESIRRFIPIETSKDAEELAKKQAVGFVEEEDR